MISASAMRPQRAWGLVGGDGLEPPDPLGVNEMLYQLS